MEKRLLTPEEAAEVLAVSPRQVRRLVHDKAIPGLHIGRKIRIDAQKLEEQIQRGTDRG